jgi:hypothetical protein
MKRLWLSLELLPWFSLGASETQSWPAGWLGKGVKQRRLGARLRCVCIHGPQT